MNTITIKNQTLGYLGDASMLLCPMTAFLCSHRVPEGVTEAIRQWVNGLDPADTCVICGNLTGEERFARRLLVERGIPVVLALANAIPDDLSELRLAPQETAALHDGKMVIISPIIDSTVKDASGRTSAARNRLMIAIAVRIVVGFMAETGNLASQLLGMRNVTVLHSEGQDKVRESDRQKAQDNARRMGWAIYNRLKEGRLATVADDDLSDDAVAINQEDAPVPSAEELMPWEAAPHSASPTSASEPMSSIEMRQLLAQYLKLDDIEKPSLLHSLILFQVVKHYSRFEDFNFTAFFRLWGPENLRPEDWKATKVNDVWLPSLADRVMTRLFKAMPSKFHEPVNKDEKFDPQLAHLLLDEALRRARKPNKRLHQRALNLAYFERDSEAITRYRELLGKEGTQNQNGR